MKQTSKLTNLQAELLKVFSFDLPEAELKEIKNLLAKYFADKASDEMDKLWEQNNWSSETIQEWSQEHLRTKYE